MFQDFGITVHFFQALQAYWAESAAQKRMPQPARNKSIFRQLKSHVGRVLVETGLKLQGRRQLYAG